MKLCICGCNRPVTGDPRRIYHDKQGYCEHNWQMCQRKLGLIKPVKWGKCSVCGEYFPVYRQDYGKKQTCPEWLNNCRKAGLNNYKFIVYRKPQTVNRLYQEYTYNSKFVQIYLNKTPKS